MNDRARDAARLDCEKYFLIVATFKCQTTMAHMTKSKPSKKAKPIQPEPESEEEEEEEEGYSSPSVLETGDGGNIESDLDAGSDEELSVWTPSLISWD
jgi:hypothetical protein